MYGKISNGHITDSLSTVPVSHVNDVTLSRVFDTQYLNNTNKTLNVLVSVIHTTVAAGEIAKVLVYDNTVNIAMVSGIESGPARASASTTTIPIAPGHQYSCYNIVTGGASNAVVKWLEVY